MFHVYSYLNGIKNKDHQSRNFRVQYFLASCTYVRRVGTRDGAKDRLGETFHGHNPTQYRKFVTHSNNCSDVTLVYICKDHHCFPITDEKLKLIASKAKQNQGGCNDLLKYMSDLKWTGRQEHFFRLKA